MKPDGSPQDALGKLLPEMQSNDGSAPASEGGSKNMAGPSTEETSWETTKEAEMHGQQTTQHKKAASSQGAKCCPQPPSS